jgi:hypothetical protein
MDKNISKDDSYYEKLCKTNNMYKEKSFWVINDVWQAYSDTKLQHFYYTAYCNSLCKHEFGIKFYPNPTNTPPGEFHLAVKRVQLPLCSIRPHAMKACEGVEV